ncbi:MAG: hypothetical protein RI897_4079 [Verrucomicrobiota bacterium]|jgi:hypothetical protein
MKVCAEHTARSGERGLVTVIMLALIVLVAIYVRLNSGSIERMKQEVELISRTSAVSSPVEREAGDE